MMDTGDTAFIMICTALVFLMTPGDSYISDFKRGSSIHEAPSQ